MVGACSTHGTDKSAYNILVGKLEGKRPRGKKLGVAWMLGK